MRDTAEEEKIRDYLCLVCQTLSASSPCFPILPARPTHTPSTDEAALYNAATYVHCKAGRSCSVAAVMAYLIHAHHWPLSRAYAFVVVAAAGYPPTSDPSRNAHSGSVTLTCVSAPGFSLSAKISLGVSQVILVYIAFCKGSTACQGEQGNLLWIVVRDNLMAIISKWDNNKLSWADDFLVLPGLVTEIILL